MEGKEKGGEEHRQKRREQDQKKEEPERKKTGKGPGVEDVGRREEFSKCQSQRIPRNHSIPGGHRGCEPRGIG